MFQIDKDDSLWGGKTKTDTSIREQVTVTELPNFWAEQSVCTSLTSANAQHRLRPFGQCGRYSNFAKMSCKSCCLPTVSLLEFDRYGLTSAIPIPILVSVSVIYESIRYRFGINKISV